MALQSIATYGIKDLKDKLSDDAPARMSELMQALQDEQELPRQLETWLDLGKAIAAINGTKFKAPEIAYNNPIDWDFVKTIPQ